MVVDDIQFMNILKGKRVKLTLKTSSYLGVVQRINPNKTLVLADVVSVSNGCRYPGSKIFFGREILNVEFHNETKRDSGSINDPRLEDQLNVEEFQPYRKTMIMDHDEEEEYINFVVIDEFHEKFGPAVMHIKKQSVISVGADGLEVLQNGRLCWLQIATRNKVYLFDILLLGARAFKNGLSMILENKQILKVMHDCRAIAGCLIAQFGVKLTNVFDTQVADVMCFYSETGGFLPDRVSTLQEVVSLHLKVPSSQLLSLQMKSQLTKDEREMWFKRPCPVTLLKVMALSVIHLQPLRLVLLDTLMIDYMTLVDSYLHSSHYEPDGLELVRMESVLELPTELKQLQQMHLERHKWAADHYPVTEQGLLARFKRQTKIPSQPSPATEEVSQTQTGSCEPATVESPSAAQLDRLSNQKPTPPQSVSSLDVHASPDLPPQVSPVSPLTVGIGRGCTDLLMNTIGRGRPVGKEQSAQYVLPAIGRGLFFQMPSAQIPGASTGDIKSPGGMETTPSWPGLTPSQWVTPAGTGATEIPKDTSGMRGDISTATPQSLSPSLGQLFRSFTG
ncbi:piRNA biogenesis protein EXD1 [Hippoglossus stenolepis]|uniref:piRNA biogenesis protein EXD1 n=1 Tax=Hippoglossus stenolepis TaxID=195615 RepID=UPI00159C451D|nr:piRNA biogenesis protein EXD1 [Hippoglossus stenolepis]